MYRNVKKPEKKLVTETHHRLALHWTGLQFLSMSLLYVPSAVWRSTVLISCIVLRCSTKLFIQRPRKSLFSLRLHGLHLRCDRLLADCCDVLGNVPLAKWRRAVTSAAPNLPTLDCNMDFYDNCSKTVDRNEVWPSWIFNLGVCANHTRVNVGF